MIEQDLKRKELEMQKKALENSEETTAKEDQQIEVIATNIYRAPFNRGIGPIYYPYHRLSKHPKNKSDSMRWSKHPKQRPEIIRSLFHRYP